MKKINRIVFWVATLWFCLGMAATGIAQIVKQNEGPGGLKGMMTLGYPPYLLTLLGIWKLLGVIAVLMPGFAMLKEWAYAGFFFIMSGAIYSHIAIGDPLIEVFPSFLLLVLIVISWFYRRVNSKVMLPGKVKL